MSSSSMLALVLTGALKPRPWDCGSQTVLEFPQAPKLQVALTARFNVANGTDPCAVRQYGFTTGVHAGIDIGVNDGPEPGFSTSPLST